MYLQQGIMCLLLSILIHHGNDNFMGVTDFTVDIDLFPRIRFFTFYK